MSEKPTDPTAAQGGMVSKKELEALSANYFAHVHILEKDGKVRKMDSSEPGNAQKNDSKSIYFDKARIDALFAANPGSDGLKIYLGLHDSTLYACEPYYENKVMVVLVTTTKGVDNLKDTTQAAAKAAGEAASGGEGLDQGKICPPYPNC